MARARNIKPALFKNEDLGQEDPFVTILFIGLWCLADKEGMLEDRPLRIKAELFPYRDNFDINGYLTVLERLGNIRRFTYAREDEIKVIEVINFKKHQNPHHTEKCVLIPNFSRSCVITGTKPLNNGYAPADSLIPDSLIPDEAPASCSEPISSKLESVNPGSKIVFELPLNKKGTYHPVTENMILELSELYPAIDIMQQFRNMIGWLNSNQEKRKTARGVNSFINRWLSKAQDNSRYPTTGNASRSEVRIEGMKTAMVDFVQSTPIEQGYLPHEK